MRSSVSAVLRAALALVVALLALAVLRWAPVYAEPPFPVLKHLSFAPYVTAGGALHLSPGYHPESQIYYAPSRPLAVPRVPEKPTSTDIKTATEAIPSSRQARTTRTAISPRLAMRTFLNIAKDDFINLLP